MKPPSPSPQRGQGFELASPLGLGGRSALRGGSGLVGRTLFARRWLGRGAPACLASGVKGSRHAGRFSPVKQQTRTSWARTSLRGRVPQDLSLALPPLPASHRHRCTASPACIPHFAFFFSYVRAIGARATGRRRRRRRRRGFICI